jgi:hypothetical protein
MAVRLTQDLRDLLGLTVELLTDQGDNPAVEALRSHAKPV